MRKLIYSLAFLLAACGGGGGTNTISSSTTSSPTVTATSVSNTPAISPAALIAETVVSKNVALGTSSYTDSIANKFSPLNVTENFESVMGLQTASVDFSSPAIMLGLPVNTGDKITALDIIKRTSPVIQKDAMYTFSMQASITNIWKYLDINMRIPSKMYLDNREISRPPVFPGVTYPSKNSSQLISVYDSNWYASQPDFWMQDGGSGPYTVTIPGSDLDRLTFLIGGEMNFTVFIQSPPNGNFAAIALRNFYSDPTPNIATVEEYVTALRKFGEKYDGINEVHGCTLITQSVSAAIGAPLPWTIWESIPAKNPTRAAHWTAIYKGDSGNQVSSWTSLLKPGDVVNMVLGIGTQHTISVISVNGTEIETVDNLYGGIGWKKYNYEARTKPESVTIYRMDDFNTPEFRIFSWLEKNYPNYFPNATSKTETSNGYIIRSYSTNWAIGIKGDSLYVLTGTDMKPHLIGRASDYLSFADANGF